MSQSPKAPHQPAKTSPEFKFKTKPVKERSIWESYAALPPRTRLYVSLGITAFAAIGLYASDKLEDIFPAQSGAATKPSSQPPPSPSS